MLPEENSEEKTKNKSSVKKLVHRVTIPMEATGLYFHGAVYYAEQEGLNFWVGG